jgi:hypothetical protein
MNKLLLTFYCGIFTISSIAQAPIGGKNVYEFLNLSPSARVTGLGGNLITVKDDDVALALQNPSALNPSMNNQLSFNHNIHLAGINNGFVNYGRYIKKWDATIHGGLQYMSYGNFDATDEYGNITGTFKAAEYAFVAGAAKQLYEKLSVGANLKFITSQFEAYNSVGMVADFGAFYQDTSGTFSISLVMKNVGMQFSKYGENRESVPFELQIGLSKRLKHLPLRFSVIYQQLNRWNIIYDDPNSEEAPSFIGGTEQQANDNSFVDNLFRHLIFNAEFLLGKKENFRLRFGYNYFQKKEFSIDNYRSLAGFTLGFGFKVNRFRIEYGRNFYAYAGGLNHFSISTNISEFKK